LRPLGAKLRQIGVDLVFEPILFPPAGKEKGLWKPAGLIKAPQVIVTIINALVFKVFRIQYSSAHDLASLRKKSRYVRVHRERWCAELLVQKVRILSNPGIKKGAEAP